MMGSFGVGGVCGVGSRNGSVAGPASFLVVSWCVGSEGGANVGLVRVTAIVCGGGWERVHPVEGPPTGGT